MGGMLETCLGDADVVGDTGIERVPAFVSVPSFCH